MREGTPMAHPPEDLRELLGRLEAAGELLRVRQEVDPLNFEIAAFIRHSENAANQAVLFERVRGYETPVVANLYGSIGRCAMAAGIEPSADDLARLRRNPRASAGGLASFSVDGYTLSETDRVGAALLRERIVAAEIAAAQGEFPLALSENPPCQEVVHRGNVHYADLFPTPMLCEGDAAHFINPGGLVQRDPDSGVLNVGCHRHQVDVSRYGRGRIGARTGEFTDGWRIFRKYEERGEDCPAALCIGLDPVSELLNCYTSPHLFGDRPYSELNSAGAIYGHSLPMAKCVSIDLEVPANTEIVIEGIMPAGGRVEEGPMAEYTDLVHGHGAWPFLEITAITHRRAPYCHVLLSGRSEEHRVLSIITGWGMEEGLVARARRHFPNVVDAAFFPGSHISHAVVSFKKRYEDEERQIAHYLLSTNWFKFLTLVDDDVDPHNAEEVEWARGMRIGQADQVIVLPHMRTWALDPLCDEHQRVTKVAFLATRPFGQRYERTGPPAATLAATAAAFDEARRAQATAPAPAGR